RVFGVPNSPSEKVSAGTQRPTPESPRRIPPASVSKAKNTALRLWRSRFLRQSNRNKAFPETVHAQSFVYQNTNAAPFRALDVPNACCRVSPQMFPFPP